MFSSFITDAVVVVAVLGFMILIHELGHFMAAKFFGVRVLVFSLGFGKRLFGFKRGDTDYRVSALPFGGFVKMAGDDPAEVREGDPGEFLARPRWQRFVVVVMGPAMNALLAVGLLTGLYRYHFQKPAYQEQAARVGDVEPDSPAARIGVLPGDLIVRLDGEANPKWEDVEVKILTTVGEALPVELLRDGQTLKLSLTPQARGPSRVGDAGWFPYVPGTIEMVDPGLPASQLGLKLGDQIVGVEGRKVFFWPRLTYLIQSANGREMELTIRREGKDFTVRVKPVLSEVSGEKMWRIGVGFRSNVVVQQLPWGKAITASLRDNLRNSLATFEVLRKILTRRMSARSLSGPIGIAQLSGEMYRAGITELLMFVSFISLQLSIFNLLPIPILDGGVIFLLLIEGLMRRDLSLEVKERFAQVGIVFLLLLAVFVMYNDILKTFRPY
ncbi:MAG: RIP metalloprotease RseP [Acidobacteriia bacterium]|nr:RIP metalloprotease RseP [Terriglobia bacterium]